MTLKQSKVGKGISKHWGRLKGHELNHLVYPKVSMGRLYIYLLIYHQHQPNVGKYTSPMDPTGIQLSGDSIPRFSTAISPQSQDGLFQVVFTSSMFLLLMEEILHCM